MKKITNEEAIQIVRRIIIDNHSFDDLRKLDEYIFQQEKKDKLLDLKNDLIKEMSKTYPLIKVINELHAQIKALEEELKWTH